MIYAIINNRYTKVFFLNTAWLSNKNLLSSSQILLCKMVHSINNTLNHLANLTH